MVQDKKGTKKRGHSGREKNAAAMKKKKQQPKKKVLPKKKGRKGWQIFFTGFLWLVFIFIAGFAWLWYDLPDLNKLKIAKRRPRIEFLDSNHKSLISYGDKHLKPIKLRQISSFVPRAIMAIEDHRFYDHMGIDLLGLMRACFINITAGRVQQGGSTLTQQLAKTLFLSPKRTLKRKLQEVIVSIWLERNFSKNQMLTIYLNRVYMGPGLYGFSAAAQHYFKKDLRQISLWEAAGLAGMLKAPNTYSPFYNIDRFKKRTTLVLGRMQELNYISKSQEHLAVKALQAYKPGEKKVVGSSARYFTDWIYRRIHRYIDHINQDLVVTTTYSPSAQQALDRAVHFFKKTKSLDDAQVAMIVMGRGGQVKGMVGGRNYFSSSFNRAFQAKRQTGSIFKLFVYMAGLMNGIMPGDKIKDTPLRLGGWRPKNFAWKSRGYLTVAEAFAYSVNTVTVRIAKKIGVRTFLKLANNMGVLQSVPEKPDLTMSLGSLESSLLLTTGAFCTIANDCRKAEPYGISKIATQSGKVLYQRKKKQGAAIASKKVCTNITALLTKVADYGTGKKVRRSGHVSCAKTGTTQNHRDAWFIGFEQPYVLGVWIGNDNNSPLPGRMTGGQMPALLWKLVMSYLKK